MGAATETFFRSRWVEQPKGVEELDPAQLAPGFRAAGRMTNGWPSPSACDMMCGLASRGQALGSETPYSLT